jgi:hypothetical protein
MATAIGDLVVRLGLDEKQFKRGIHAVVSRLADGQKAFTIFGMKAAAGMAAATAAVAAFKVREQINEVKELATVAQKLGMHGGQLATLQHAAVMADADISQLHTGLERMVKSVAEAAGGIGSAREELAALGLDARGLMQLDPSQMFRAIAGAMQGVDNQSERLRLTLAIFGRSSSSLVNILGGGTDYIDKMTREAKRLGIAISDIDIAKIEAVDEALKQASQAMKGTWRALAVELSPAVTALGKVLTGLAADINAALGRGGSTGQPGAAEMPWQMDQLEIAKQIRAERLKRSSGWVKEGKYPVGSPQNPIDYKSWMEAGRVMRETAEAVAEAKARLEQAKAAAEKAAAAEQAELKKTADQWTGLFGGLGLGDRVKGAIGGVLRQTAAYNKTLEELNGKVKVATDYNAELRQELERVDWTDRQRKIQDIADMGVPQPLIDGLRELDRQLTALGKHREAIKAMEDFNREQEDIARTYNERFKSPFERYIEEVNRIQSVADRLAPGVKEAALAQAQKDFEGADKGFSTGPRYGAAAERGSREAYSILVNSRKDDGTKKLVNINTKQLDALNRIDRNLQTEQRISIPTA